jgi:hypothetical protein
MIKRAGYRPFYKKERKMNSTMTLQSDKKKKEEDETEIKNKT